MDERVAAVLADKKATQTTLVAVDFDECAIEEHLSRKVTDFYKHRAEIQESDKQGHGVDAITGLFKAYVGLTRLEFESSVQNLATSVTWRAGFKNIAARLSSAPYFFVAISSGLSDAARMAFVGAGLSHIEVIASDVAYDGDDRIIGPGMVVGDVEKAQIVEMLKEKGGFNRVITVGHSAGDIPLIRSGSSGYRFALRDKDEAIAVADHVLDSWSDLNTYL